jgi:hypothetical protein
MLFAALSCIRFCHYGRREIASWVIPIHRKKRIALRLLLWFFALEGRK